MNRKILFAFLVLIVLAVPGWFFWRSRMLPWQQAGPSVRSARAPEINNLPLSSEELIAKALSAKEIDYETSLLYRAYALFGDPRLPQKYATNVIDLDAGTALFSEIFAGKGQLSPVTLSTLTPFLARPNDPQSVLYTSRSASTGSAFLPSVSAAGKWIHSPAAGGLVQVWTNPDFHLAAPPQAYVDAVNHVWPKLRELIRPPTPDEAGDPSMEINPDSAIDVYIVPHTQIDPRPNGCGENPTGNACRMVSAMGLTCPTAPRIGKVASSGYLIIDGLLRDDALLATMAHELFHASQDSYTNNQRWLAEATATWGEYRVMINLGRPTTYETGYLSAFFPKLASTPLDRYQETRTHQYGAYLYFMFAQMERDDGVVSDIWAATNVAGEAQAVDAVFPFREHFRDFALRNWNAGPVPKLYNTVDPGFPDYHPPRDVVSAVVDQSQSLGNAIPSLAAHYYVVTVADNIAKLRVNLGELALNPAAGVDAIVTIDKKAPEIRHWTGQPEVIFCRDDPDQKVDSFVLVVSNANLKDELVTKIDLEPYSKPCGDGGDVSVNIHMVWTTEYTMSYKHESNTGQMKDRIVIVYDGSLHAQAAGDSEPWDMNSGTMDERVTVSGGGSGSITGVDEKGVASQYSQSWIWMLKDAPKNLGGGVSFAPDGAYSFNLPSLSGVKTEPQIQGGETPKDLKGAMNASFGALMLTPHTATGMGYPSREPGFPDSDPKFWSEFSGNFDPKSRTVAKSGSAQTSRQDHSTGSIPGLASTTTYSIQVAYSFHVNPPRRH